MVLITLAAISVNLKNITSVRTRHPFRWGKRRIHQIPFVVNNNRADVKTTVAILRDQRPPITPPLFQINKTKNNETQKFQLSKCKYKIALASTHPIQENSLRKCPYQSPKKICIVSRERLVFLSTGTSRTLDSQTPGSRTAVHVLMGEKKCMERRNLTESTIVRRSIDLPVLFESCRGSVHTRP
ncbi:hypothetical protein TNCV_4556021 [Trichonephila clavipes]|nr:hypothetical protein TNCV_4556021 [Trichonephila clavipes]